jgi:hypothetical protein
VQLNISVSSTGALLSGKAPEIVQKGLDQAVSEATLFLYNEVAKRTPQGVFGAQGGLLGSIQHDVQGRGTPLIKGIVSSAHKYAEVIEKGRTAGKGMPPRGSLVFWITKKFGIGAWQAAKIEYVVRRSIGRKGFKGRHMFEKALSENFSRVQGIFEKHGLLITEELSK